MLSAYMQAVSLRLTVGTRSPLSALRAGSRHDATGEVLNNLYDSGGSDDKQHHVCVQRKRL